MIASDNSENRRLKINCLPCYSIQRDAHNENPDENSPILHELPVRESMQTYDKIFLVILLLILFTGFGTGLYLLIREGHEWRSQEVYNLTSRELWQAHIPSSTMPKLKLPASRVLLLHTNSSGCDSKSQCSRLVHELQLKHMSQKKEPDILYNFLVSGDGSVFEGRGWQFESDFPDNYDDVVTLAFLGKFDVNPPTPKQAESAKLFVDVAVMEGHLELCYNILVWGENRFFIDIAESIQEERAGCEEIT